jgi:hypothetical protein
LPLPGWPISASTTLARGALHPAERADEPLIRVPGDQRDVDVDIAQFRDVVTAGREILHVDVPQ